MKTVILGATFYGCGLAAAHKNALILDCAALPGWEYALTLDPGTNYGLMPKHPAALEFGRELKARKALQGDFLRAAALAPMLAAWCMDRKLEIRFNADIVSLRENELEFLGAAGREMVRFDRLIDARPRPKKEKYLHILMEGKSEAGPGIYGGMEIRLTEWPDRILLRSKIPAEVTWQEARQRFYRSWAEYPPPSTLHPAWMATRFSHNDFDNPIAALDAGLSLEVLA